MSLTELLNQTGMTLEIVVWSMFTGVMIASMIAVYFKCILGSFVRKLRKESANSPSHGKTLSETGFDKNPFVKFSLRRHSGFRRVIYGCNINTEGESEESVEKQNDILPKGKNGLSEMKFYIPPKFADKAEELYGDSRGSSIISVILSAFVFLIASLLVMALVPYFVKVIGNIFG